MVRILWIVSLFLAAVLFVACGDDNKEPATDTDETVTDDTVADDTATDDTVTDQTVTDETVTDDTTTDEMLADDDVVTAVVNSYAGSGANGDLVVFDINQTLQTYTTFNETTQTESSGGFEVLEDELAGMYRITDGDDTFFAVELSDKVLAANFDTGNPNNTISFGVSSETDYTGNTAAITGNYIYIHISSLPVNGAADIKEWGLFSIFGNRSLLIKAFATGPGTDTELTPLAPEDFAEALPLGAGDLSGNWSPSATEEKRVDVYLNETQATLTGFVLTEGDRAIFVIDMGTGNGFILGLELEETQLADIAGDYKFVNVWNDPNGAGRSAGKAVIDPTGTSLFYHFDTTGTLSSGELEGVTRCPNLGNVYYATTTETNGTDTVTEKIYFVVMGDIFMAFGFRTDNGAFSFASYAAGAKLP